jgi:hypothetical protein
MNHTHQRQIRARRKRSGWIDIMLFQHATDDANDLVAVARAQPPVWQTFDPKDLATPYEPTLSLPPETAQQLMDELWTCGLRPKEGKGCAHQIR